MKRISLLSLFLFPLIAWAQSPVSDRLVEVITTRQEYDPFLPWRHGSPEWQSGYGILMGDGSVLTTETLVRNARLVELRRAQSGTRIPATIRIADPQVNLALLTTADRKAGDLDLLPVEPLIQTNSALRMIQFNESRQIQEGSATYLHATMAPLPSGPYAGLRVTLMTDLTLNGEGAPVMAGEALAGLVMESSSSSRMVDAIPGHTIARFLADTASNFYAGVASAGILWSPLIDTFKRNYLGAASFEGGCVILSVISNSPTAAALQTDDILLEWDGHELDSLGFYEDPDFGRLDLSFAVKGRRRPGDQVPVRILREGSETNVNLVLAARPDSEQWIPEAIDEVRPGYIVDGGFVIREVTGRYILAQGERGDTRLQHLYRTQRHVPPEPGARVVILASLLPDPINRGYPALRDEIITHVNGEPIRNLGSVFDILSRDGHLYRLTLQGFGTDLVLDPSEMDAANQRIARQFDLQRLTYRPFSTTSDVR